MFPANFSTNILPKMGYEKLAEGYRKVINAVYSPELYYQRVKAFLREYLGPAFYIVGPRQAKHLKLGDTVTVSGSRVTVKGEPLMIAMTVKRGNEVLRLRDQEGLLAWIGWKQTSD
jgi:hypothetical protein